MHPDNYPYPEGIRTNIRIGFSAGAHPLNIFMAEEMSHLYLMAQLAEDRQRDMRTRLTLALEENTRCNQSRNRITARLRHATIANAGMIEEIRQLRRDLANRDRTIAALQDSNNQYRRSFGQAITQRAIPRDIRPHLERIRAETENQRMAARLNLVEHFRALRNRVIAELPTTEEEVTTDDGQETDSDVEQL